MSAFTSRFGARLVTTLACLVLAVSVGVAVPGHPLIAAVLALVALGVGVSAVHPMALPLLALPTLLVVQRVGGGGIDLSVSDLALILAVLPAGLLGLRPYSPEMRNILWLTVIYQVTTLFTVIANPYPANAVEWVHMWFLTGGALLVGYGVGRAGLARTGLWLIFAMACLISLAVVIQFVINVSRGSFEPVYVEWPVAMHKNFTGTTLGIVAAVAYAAPPWLAMRRNLTTAIFWWCALGLAMSQSRQAIVALALVLVLLVLRTEQERRRSKLIFLLAVPALVIVMTLVRDQVASGKESNSVFQRLTWFEDSLEIWSTSPVWGVGLRWWYTDRFDAHFQPPNAEIEVLTSSGIVGLIGFLVLMLGTMVVLWRLGPLYGGIAVMAVLSRFLQGQFDLFWAAVQVPLAFAIAGLCLGNKAMVDDETELTAEVELLRTPA